MPHRHSQTVVPLLASLLGVSVLIWLGLREFAFSDYETEAMPAVGRFVEGDMVGFISALPGYGGAVMVQAPFALIGDQFGGDRELWTWRLQALPGLLLLVSLATLAGRTVVVRVEGRRGIVWGAITALVIGGSPFGILAFQAGHIEEILICGLVTFSVVLAARGNVLLGAVIVGIAAAAKPWAVIAIPVVLVAASDRRTLFRSLGACTVAGALLLAPAAISGGHEKVTGAAHASTSGVFKPANVFWFAGEANPEWGAARVGERRLFEPDPTKAIWAQRLEPSWAASVSHPLIVGVALLLSAGFWVRRRREPERGAEDLLLLLATVAWWRCLLDTWNTGYYAAGALLALAIWEARRGRPPVFALTMTLLTWTAFELLPWWRTTPDAHTALYLSWALPAGVGLVVRLLAPAGFSGAASRITGPLSIRLPTLARFLRGSPVVGRP